MTELKPAAAHLLRDTDVVDQAYRFAAVAHGQQKRKYTGEPYINHPRNVAGLVKTAGGTDAMVAAAYLHDVVEDTPVTNADIRDIFGNEIADLVGWVTDVSRPEDGNRAARKAIDCAHLAAAPAEAQTIKLADLIDNTASIRDRDPDFWKVYRLEKLALLEVLTKGDPNLFELARLQCQGY